MFDSAFAKPVEFKKLSKKANLAHVRHTYRLSPTTEDKDIYQLATQEKRFVITMDRDFKRLVKPGSAGVIFIPPYLSTEQIDEALVKFISGKTPDVLLGKSVRI